MPRKPDQLPDQFSQLPTCPRFRINPHLTTSLSKMWVVVVVLDLFRQRVNTVQRQAECLPHITDGRTAAIGHDLGRDTGPLPSVLGIKILQHFLATLMFEIHINIGCLVPLPTDKPFEQHVSTVGINSSNPQTVTNSRICRRAATLAKNATIASKLYQIPNCQKIRFILEFRDQLQFMLNKLSHLGRYPDWIPCLRSLPS